MLTRMPDPPPKGELSASSTKDAHPVRKMEAQVATPPVAGLVKMRILGQVDGDAGVVYRLVSARAAPSRAIGVRVKKGVYGQYNGLAAVHGPRQNPARKPIRSRSRRWSDSRSPALQSAGSLRCLP